MTPKPTGYVCAGERLWRPGSLMEQKRSAILAEDVVLLRRRRVAREY